MSERESSIPTGRLQRTMKVSGLVGTQAAKAYATKAANLARTDGERRAAAQRRQMQAAEQIVEVLGSMKGAAMKVGQVASFIDTGVVGSEAQERFQAKLAELRDAAPAASFPQMRRVIEDDLGGPLDSAFAEFDSEAVAAASIGQVYRARLHDGREVGVKVQYPGVARAVRADLQNMGLILRALKRMAPGMDAKAMASEIRERLSEELDYELEAQSQRAFARTWRGHPFIVIPDVVTNLCTEHVLVTEWVDGMRFEEVKQLSQAQRDRFGEIVYRFFMGSLYRTRHFSGDPHPGNFLLMGDGRLAFLDFGMTKRVPREQVDGEIEVIRRGLEGDAEGLHAGLAAFGFFDCDDPVLVPELVLEHFQAVTSWYGEDRPFTVDPEYVGQVLIDMGDPRSRYWEMMKRETMPPQAMLGRRMEALVLGVLGALGATGNWHRIAREWLYDHPPATALGEAELEFFAARAR